MRLRPKHIAQLSAVERRIYAPLIGPVSYQRELRTLFISQSESYIENDEKVLPFPERSKRGVMLFSLCQHLAASQAAVVYDPVAPKHAVYIKRKMLALGAKKVYAVPPEHLLACIYGNGENPFQFWRDEKPLSLAGLNYNGADASSSVLCALEPPESTIHDTSEWSVRGALLKTPENTDQILALPIFKEVAHAGLTDVVSVGDKSWITRELPGTEQS